MLNLDRIWNSRTLPTLPTVAVRLLELCQDHNSGIADMVQVIKTDPALTARLLAAANSALFGLANEVRTVDRAAPLLGRTAVTSLALSFSLVDTGSTGGDLDRLYRQYWTNSVLQAAACETIAHDHLRRPGGEYFLAGLLLDLGRLALLKTIGAEYRQVVEAAESRGLLQAEREMLGADHAEIGAELMRRWKMPDTYIQITRLHHEPVSSILALRGTPHYDVARAAHVAAAAAEFLAGSDHGAALLELRQRAETLFEIQDEALDEFLAATRNRAATTAELLQLDLGDLEDPVDLMARANSTLVELAMREANTSRQLEAANAQLALEKEQIELERRELHHKALTDPLTGVYNRAFFDEVLTKEFSRCARQHSSVGIVFIDVDHFKLLNDTYGHAFGDVVLRAVAEAFQRTLRASDIIARYGGEEFVVLLPMVDEAGIDRVAERIRAGVEELGLKHGDRPVQVTACVGGAICLPARDTPEFATSLLGAADAAMYDCKRNGRNRSKVVVLDADSLLPCDATVEA